MSFATKLSALVDVDNWKMTTGSSDGSRFFKACATSEIMPAVARRKGNVPVT